MLERRKTSMHVRPRERHELDKIATATLAHYERHAEEFRGGTRDHDVSQNIAFLLRPTEGESPFTILDFGAGPGRDLKTFAICARLSGLFAPHALPHAAVAPLSRLAHA
jgi:hypothetical protein